jgi:hypothetical protein
VAPVQQQPGWKVCSMLAAPGSTTSSRCICCCWLLLPRLLPVPLLLPCNWLLLPRLLLLLLLLPCNWLLLLRLLLLCLLLQWRAACSACLSWGLTWMRSRSRS